MKKAVIVCKNCLNWDGIYNALKIKGFLWGLCGVNRFLYQVSDIFKKAMHAFQVLQIMPYLFDFIPQCCLGGYDRA